MWTTFLLLFFGARWMALGLSQLLTSDNHVIAPSACFCHTWLGCLFARGSCCGMVCQSHLLLLACLPCFGRNRSHRPLHAQNVLHPDVKDLLSSSPAALLPTPPPPYTQPTLFPTPSLLVLTSAPIVPRLQQHCRCLALPLPFPSMHLHQSRQSCHPYGTPPP